MEGNIVNLLIAEGEKTPKELSMSLNLSRQLIHRYLKKLAENKTIVKTGKSPKVYYSIPTFVTQPTVLGAAINIDLVNEHFIEITADGRFLTGIEAFEYWCQRRQLPLEKTINEFATTFAKYEQYKKNGFISGLQKLKDTKALQNICLSDVLYLDFYVIERFGKTTLGKLIHFGKQSQNRRLMQMIVEKSFSLVHQLLIELKIDAIAFIPPTIKRDIQIMTILETGFNIALPKINLIKVKGEIIVPQKALSKIEDRIENTQRSIMVDENRNFQNVLIIDDAVGSGATINETACKLLNKKIAKQVYGLAITGSYKGFDVITEA